MRRDTGGRQVCAGRPRDGGEWTRCSTLIGEWTRCSTLISLGAALLCVHGAHVHGGGLHAEGVAIMPAHLLRSALGYDRVLADTDVALLATTARTSLRPAA
jgi:hypothetical protein